MTFAPARNILNCCFGVCQHQSRGRLAILKSWINSEESIILGSHPEQRHPFPSLSYFNPILSSKVTSAVSALKPAQGYKGPLQMPPLLAFVPQPSYPGIQVKRKRFLQFVKNPIDCAHNVVCCCRASSPKNNHCASRILDGGGSDSQTSRNVSRY